MSNKLFLFFTFLLVFGSGSRQQQQDQNNKLDNHSNAEFLPIHLPSWVWLFLNENLSQRHLSYDVKCKVQCMLKINLFPLWKNHLSFQIQLTFFESLIVIVQETL